MIPLQFNKLEDKEKKETVKEFYNLVLKKRDPKKIVELNDWCLKNLHISGKNI